jgi:hypothetical protein
MIKMIIITEVCEEGSGTSAYNYDLLPDNIKNKVQEALYPKFGPLNMRLAYVDIYKDGLQYLHQIKHPVIQPGEIVEYMNSVTLYHDYNCEDDDE